MKTHILGVLFDVVTNAQAINKLKSFLKEDKNHMLFTPNPEIVMRAQKDEHFKSILKQADLVIADGIGIVIASRIKGAQLKERVTGCDTIQTLFANVETPTTVYLLGGQNGVAELAKKNINERYKNISVVGLHHGYFNKEEERLILEEIKTKKPHILIVGLGFPRQEKWIYENRNLPVRISAGLGGSIDILAGTVKRAPKIYQKLGLEWLYRVIKQPQRIFRLGVFPSFVFKVILERFKGRV